jgi:hypothetical protein
LSGLTVKTSASCWADNDGETTACPEGLIVENSATITRNTVTYLTRKHAKVKD